jgi:hypothetical protein
MIVTEKVDLTRGLEPVMAFEFKLLKTNGLVGSHGFLGGLVTG